ncbi:MAG: serine hydrolase domain-containing protein [Candidatus Alcyoniella australis]|nr:serine hydrolase domain-containing protein [Candidatus Alcyoniella australis]
MDDNGTTPAAWQSVVDLLETGRRDNLFSCYDLVAGRGDQTRSIRGGWAQREPEARKLDDNPIFDLGSLTKVICTTTLVMQAVDQGLMRLDQTVAELWPEFPAPWASKVTLTHLLSHSSGLAATRPYFEKMQGVGDILSRVAIDPLDATPGRVSIYSDLGFMVLGRILEIHLGARLDQLFYTRVAQPLGLEQTFFLPIERGKSSPQYPTERFVATERCRNRGRVLVAEVHDHNAWAMGGVVGHAGLFGTASDVFRFGRMTLDSWQGRGPLPTEQVRLFANRAQIVQGSDRALGWDTPSSGRSSSGTMFGSQAIGHLGYVGTSLWVDLQSGTLIVLLTNRVHPEDTAAGRRAMRAFRPGLHDVVWEALDPGLDT